MPVPRGFLGNVGWGTLVFVCSVTPRTAELDAQR
jgi:hypothetical protein